MYQPSIFISQLNYNPENIDHNYNKITKSYQESVDQAADIVIFSRYAVSGYIQKIPTLYKDFFNQCTSAINKLTLQTNNKNTTIIIGSIKEKDNVIFETIYLIKNGKITELIEFPAGSQSSDISVTFTIDNINIILLLISRTPKLPIYNNDTLLLIMDSTQYTQDTSSRDDLILRLTFNKYAVYINQIGGYGNLVFHGKSFFTFNNKYYFLNMWKEDSKICKTDLAKQTNPNIIRNNIESDYQALMLALRDYIHKNSMTSVIMGLSGGIDSALVASIAADALGSNNVHSLMLPTKYTSQMSITDSKECAMRLGISYNILSIEKIFQTSLATLHNTFINTEEDITEENLQARIRGTILMAFSNKFKFMLLSTGNKSELFIGYATLYGDMCGGFAPIKDIYKTKVYELSRWRNKNIPVNSLCQKIDVIPSQIIEKHPSAELRYNQKDQDTLPDYTTLDSVLTLLIDQNYSIEDVIKKGYDIQDVKYIVHLIQKSQFKREQASTGPLIN
ncbi:MULTISPECIES: NAD(+) synthase [Ehrlichia]|uniref:Glutamine-dependent NAD(+) synthetase n=1 Tax=Ehrlichia cf. muris str. EmCRT TaxID=1359167 RepID=A0A0F3NG46_9RICK|nr:MULTISPECIES: NAD(+) synthase [Ehrlichia]KJV65874.1 NAD+ synthetase [Ehrlichia cf. muris str. EmCRT]OUC04104.1 NAD+ synthetase [Ehrlichia sp. Wisconsin_h]